MPRSPSRIVAIDCDAALGQQLLTVFWGPEYQFHWFPDGREALGRLQAIRPDVIICELMLPGLDGRSVLETIRLWPELRDVRFLVLSSVRSKSVIRGMLDAGATAYLVKPCPVRRLKQAIDEVLENAPQRPDVDLRDVEVPESRSGPVDEPGPVAAVEPPINAPPPAMPMDDQPTQLPRRKARKRKPRAVVQPATAPEVTAGPGVADATPMISGEREAPVSLALENTPWELAAAPHSTLPTSLSWSYVPRAAAALLALGVLSDGPRESSWAKAPDPAPRPETRVAPISQRSDARSDADLPAPTPTAEGAPQAPVEPSAAPHQRSPERVERLVRGRLEWAQALYDDGRYDDARTALREVFKLAPSNEQARQLDAKLAGSVLGATAAGTPSASDADHRAVLALLGRYQAAFDEANAPALKAIWPDVDPWILREWWKDADSRKLTLRLVDLEVTGDEAVAMCVSYDSLLTTAGEKREGNSRVTFHLRRANGSWVIDAVK
jgi:CheY-like chemotaxis protein